MEELLGSKDGGHLCLEAALAAGDAEQVPRALIRAQRRHLLLSVHVLHAHLTSARLLRCKSSGSYVAPTTVNPRVACLDGGAVPTIMFVAEINNQRIGGKFITAHKLIGFQRQQP